MADENGAQKKYLESRLQNLKDQIATASPARLKEIMKDAGQLKNDASNVGIPLDTSAVIESATEKYSEVISTTQPQNQNNSAVNASEPTDDEKKVLHGCNKLDQNNAVLSDVNKGQRDANKKLRDPALSIEERKVLEEESKTNIKAAEILKNQGYKQVDDMVVDLKNIKQSNPKTYNRAIDSIIEAAENGRETREAKREFSKVAPEAKIQPDFASKPAAIGKVLEESLDGDKELCRRNIEQVTSAMAGKKHVLAQLPLAAKLRKFSPVEEKPLVERLGEQKDFNAVQVKSDSSLVKNFSERDKDKVNQCGETLDKNGVTYDGVSTSKAKVLSQLRERSNSPARAAG